MYDATLGRFIQRDPYESTAEKANFYSYAASSPTNLFDATGLAPTLGITQGKITLGKYGQFDWPITWTVNPAPNMKGKRPTDIVGVIIQRVQMTYWAVDANGRFIPLPKKFSGKREKDVYEYTGYAYAEAWKVQNDGTVLPIGNFLNSTANDWYWFGGTPVPTCGRIQMNGYATYYPGIEPWQLKRDYGFEEGWARGAGALLSYAIPPGRLGEKTLSEQREFVDRNMARFENFVQRSKIEPSRAVEHDLTVQWDMNKNDGQVEVTDKKPE
jgi:hypothetical protein